MSEVEIVSSEINTTEISALHGIGPSDNAENSQSKAQDNPVCSQKFLHNYPLMPHQPSVFNPSHLTHQRQGSAKLILPILSGKVFANAYHISAKPEDDLPGSFGFAFTDGSRYHVRISGPEEADIDIDVDEDDLAGKHVTAASLLRYEGHFFYHYPSIGLWNDGMMDHVALGLKMDGSEEWVKLIATEEEYDSDGDGLAKSEYHDVFLVKMKGIAAKKTRPRKR